MREIFHTVCHADCCCIYTRKNDLHLSNMRVNLFTTNVKWMEIVKKRAEPQISVELSFNRCLSLVSFSYRARFFFLSVCNKGSCQPIRPLLKYG